MFEEYDEYEHLPKTSKISPAACLGRRVNRPLCSCCGGSRGIRRSLRKVSRHHNNFYDWEEERPKIKRTIEVYLLPKKYKPKLKKNLRMTIRYE